MHLIIQIPCFNEAETLPIVLADLPTSLPGVARIEVLIIDDGSTDETVAVARQLGVHHIVRHPRNLGLAAAFQTGLNACLQAGADVIVNTDGDNQYPADQIGRLIAPVLAGQADMVIGDRQTGQIEHFSPVKKMLQNWGSWVVRVASGTQVPDATSGFRAFSQEAALRLTILTRYTYTLETIIQAGKKGLAVAHVPIEYVNPPTRDSRLMKNTWSYIKRSTATILRIYTLYEPLRTFAYTAFPFLGAGVLLLARFLFLYLFSDQNATGRYLQSVTIGASLLTVGFLIFLFGVMADITATNRFLLEEMLYRQRKRELGER
jgi:glycosyltransferase involved in cell wall biosynthesis